MRFRFLIKLNFQKPAQIYDPILCSTALLISYCKLLKHYFPSWDTAIIFQDLIKVQFVSNTLIKKASRFLTIKYQKKNAILCFSGVRMKYWEYSVFITFNFQGQIFLVLPWACRSLFFNISVLEIFLLQCWPSWNPLCHDSLFLFKQYFCTFFSQHLV